MSATERESDIPGLRFGLYELSRQLHERTGKKGPKHVDTEARYDVRPMVSNLGEGTTISD